jgi:DNA-binding MarR family transcriptional regulator
MPLSLEEAQKWAEDHLDGDEYEAIFGAVQEDESKRTVTFSLTEKTIEKIARIAAERSISKSEVIERLVDGDLPRA